MIVDVDNPDTWPSGVAKIVATCVANFQGRDTSLSDLATEAGRLDAEIGLLLAGHRLRAYHCTRLLDREVARIQAEGLHPSSERLRQDKLSAARANGDLTDDQYAILQRSQTVGDLYGLKTFSRIHLFTSTLELESHLSELASYLTYWGGEALFDGTAGLREVLGGLGRPAIICAGLDVEQIRGIDESLTAPFVATIAQWPPEHRGAVVRYGAAIPGDDIEAIWRPGDPAYDRFPGLPR